MIVFNQNFVSFMKQIIKKTTPCSVLKIKKYRVSFLHACTRGAAC